MRGKKALAFQQGTNNYNPDGGPGNLRRPDLRQLASTHLRNSRPFCTRLLCQLGGMGLERLFLRKVALGHFGGSGNEFERPSGEAPA
jgi:hypothetical protein